MHFMKSMIGSWVLKTQRYFGDNQVNLNMDFLFDMIIVSVLTFLGDKMTVGLYRKMPLFSLGTCWSTEGLNGMYLQLIFLIWVLERDMANVAKY